MDLTEAQLYWATIETLLPIEQRISSQPAKKSIQISLTRKPKLVGTARCAVTAPLWRGIGAA
jgi:hypothetical protein